MVHPHTCCHATCHTLWGCVCVCVQCVLGMMDVLLCCMGAFPCLFRLPLHCISPSCHCHAIVNCFQKEKKTALGEGGVGVLCEMMLLLLNQITSSSRRIIRNVSSRRAGRLPGCQVSHTLPLPHTHTIVSHYCHHQPLLTHIHTTTCHTRLTLP